ncbi:MAG TPA: hypothetical protein VFX20_19805 [Steroidobacteraceae bacterium]|nr:hypothetical protein [Steroidobacteraceae bacterium]
MKARTKKTRWLLLTLLFGLLAATGFALTRHGEVRFVTTADQAVPPKRAVMQPLHAPLASAGGKQMMTPAVGTPAGHELVDHAYSDHPQPDAAGHSDVASNADTASGVGQGTRASPPVLASSDGTQPGNPVATPATTSPTPREGAGSFAYDGYVPLDCGLPAGCGVGSNAGYVARRPSLAGGTMPVARDSQGTSPPNDGSQTDDPGPGSDPPGPGSNPSPAAAPELDPATLAGAVTLLLGALAVLRGRRPARVSR